MRPKRKTLDKWDAIITFDKQENEYTIAFAGTGGAVVSGRDLAETEQKWIKAMKLSEAVMKTSKYYKFHIALTKNEILEENKLIAGFYHPDSLRSDIDPNEFEYHDSFDWLIPACRKWDDLDVSNLDHETIAEYVDLCDELDWAASLYRIEPLFEQLVKNIIWYNENISKV